MLIKGWMLIEIEKPLNMSLEKHFSLHFQDLEFSKVLREASKSDSQNLWNRSHETYSTLVKAYQLVDSENQTDAAIYLDRNKRCKALLAAVATLPLVRLGITFCEALQERNYVKKLQKQFNHFAKE